MTAMSVSGDEMTILFDTQPNLSLTLGLLYTPERRVTSPTLPRVSRPSCIGTDVMGSDFNSYIVSFVESTPTSRGHATRPTTFSLAVL